MVSSLHSSPSRHARHVPVVLGSPDFEGGRLSMLVSTLVSKLAHLAAVGSVPLPRAVARALLLPFEHRFGHGLAARPLAITWEITNRCNLDCAFCFLKPDTLNSAGDELTASEALALVDEAARLGAGLYLTGGEPLIRADLPEIVARARHRGVRVGLNTNGLLLAGERGRRLLEARPHFLLVSPHSLDAGTGTGGAERAGLELAARHRNGTRMLLNCVLPHADTEGALALARRLALDGVTFQHPTLFSAALRASHGAAWTRHTGEPDPGLSAPDAPLHGFTEPATLPASNGVPVWVKPDLSAAERASWYGNGDTTIHARCHYPWTDARILANGDVVFCQFIQRRLGNVRTTALTALWNSPDMRKLRVALDAAGGSYPGCARCCKLYRATGRTVSRSSES